MSIGATLVGLIAVVYACSHQFLLSSFLKLEAQETKRNVLRATNAVHQEAERVHGLTGDWSDWIDTYNFMKDKNETYIVANLSKITIKVDLMLFIDKNGKYFHSKTAGVRNGMQPPDAREVTRALRFGERGQPWAKRADGYAGVVMLRQGPLSVSVRPIRTSEGTGSWRGWLVFAYWLDQATVDQIGETTHLKVKLTGLNESGLTPASIQTLKEGGGPTLRVLDSNTIAGYAALRDVFGQPIQILKVSEPRAIYHQGAQSVDFVVRLLVIGALVFGIVMLWVVEVAALGRVFKLSRQVERIGEQGNAIDAKVELSGSDELAKLGGRINQMLNRIREGQELLQVNNRSLEAAVAELGTTNLALENAVEGIACLDSDGFILTSNSAFASAFRNTPETLEGQHWRSILPESVHRDFLEATSQMGPLGKSSVELKCHRTDGTMFYSESVLVPLVRGDGQQDGLYWFMKDITDRKNLEMQIQHQALHDPLTGLPNRFLFLDRLNNALSRAKRHKQSVGVVFIDLDNFKVINDSLGHEAGDTLLMAVAEVLRSCIRPEDTVARLGGDEFTIILNEVGSTDEVVAVVNRIIDTFSRPVLLKSGVAFASASFGITFSECGDDLPEDMLRDADTAMYRAKGQGRSAYVIFDPSMNAAAVARMELEADLRKAIELEEFFLSYQPLIDLETGRVTGSEALLRWNHPEKGLVFPPDFMSVAEDTGLIVPIGTWALEEACRQTKDWNDKFDCTLSVSVNLSGNQLQRQDISTVVKTVLKKTGLQPGLLTLEMTETFLMRDTHGTDDKLRKLKALGVKLSIDDFGTGYSSMSGLGNMPVDSVKIDRSYIGVMNHCVNSEAIVAAMVALSKTMKFEVTAEGIEHLEQLAQLQKLGCDSAQGFFFFRPMLKEEFESELENDLLSRTIADETAA